MTQQDRLTGCDGMDRDLLGNIIIKSMVVMILSASLLELADGFLTMKFGFTYISTATRLLYLLLPLFLIIYVPVDKGIAFLCFISVLFVLMFLRLLRPETRFDAVIFDFQYLARSLLLLVSIFLFGYVLNYDRLNVLFRRYFFIQWMVITVALLMHIFLGIGGMTYSSGELRVGYTSYFSSNNQTVFIYITSWWVIASLLTRRLLVRIILTAATLAIMLAMGTRSGVVLVFMMTGLYVYKKIWDSSRLLFATALLMTVGLGVFVFMNFNYVLGLIADVFIKFSSETSKLASNVSAYGALTALVSRRDILFYNAVQAISNYDLRELLIGPNFFNYKRIVGSYTDTKEIRMAEIDPLDLLGGWGIMGVLLAYLPVIWLFYRLLKRRLSTRGPKWEDRTFFAAAGGMLISLVESAMSGHIFLSPLSILTFGLIVAVSWHILRQADSRPAEAAVEDDPK